jgi:hypothetical protein
MREYLYVEVAGGGCCDVCRYVSEYLVRCISYAWEFELTHRELCGDCAVRLSDFSHELKGVYDGVSYCKFE